MEANGLPIINLGIGSPDLNPPTKVIQALKNSLEEPSAHRYQSYQGIQEFREAIASFYKRHYSVNLSPVSEILPLMGSKEGIMHISMAYLNPGDEALIPNPGYPTYGAVTKLVGGIPRFYNLNEKNGWLPDLDALRNEDLSKVKLMWISYPHMPTGAKASFRDLENIVAFAAANDILLINDNPYSFVLNDKPRSILNVGIANKNAIELNSLSKTFNMAGWRVGMVVGDAEHIRNILKVKSNMDSGMFLGIQKGAIEALECSDLWFYSLNSVYEERRELVRVLADKLNCVYGNDQSGMFIWARLPKGFNSEEFTDHMLKKYNIFVAPGHIFGSEGEGYVRFSLCASSEVINEAIARIE